LSELVDNGQCRPGAFENTGRIALRNHESGVELICGHCAKAKLGYEQMSFFSGLHPTPNIIDAQKLAVKQEISQLEDSMTITEKATSMKLSNLRKRLARLEMKMSVIYYGADSTFDKEMIHDTIEDGVRALESAREHGVVKGSQFDLLNACKSFIHEADSELERIITRSIIQGIQATLEKDLYSKSKVYSKFRNASMLKKEVKEEATMFYGDTATGDAINRARYLSLGETYYPELMNVLCTETESDIDSFNLILMAPDERLITSAETDVCALKASIELLKILIAGNQLLMVQK
jgi:hypothetical protein